MREEEGITVTEVEKQWRSQLRATQQAACIKTKAEPKTSKEMLLNNCISTMHCHDLVRCPSFNMGVTEEGDIYPIMILVSPPLICRPAWQTRTDRNATRWSRLGDYYRVDTKRLACLWKGEDMLASLLILKKKPAPLKSKGILGDARM